MASRRVPAEPAPPPKPNVSVSQLRILLAAVEKDPWLYNAVQSDIITFLTIHKWKILSDKLNECRGGAVFDVLNWKHALHYWAGNVKKGMNMSKGRLGYNNANRAITLKEAKELTRLERRFLKFVKNEEAKDMLDVTYTGKIGADQPKGDIASASNSGVNVKVQQLNEFPVTVFNDENICPDENVYCDETVCPDENICSVENVCPDVPKKRTIHVKEDEPTDPAEVNKRLKVIFDENLALDDEEAENKQILAMTLEQLQMVARELENHIGSMQRRIQMIKGMWKYRFGDIEVEG